MPGNFALQGGIVWKAHKFDEKRDGQDTGFAEIGLELTALYYLPYEFFVGVRGGFAYIKDFPFFENREMWSNTAQKAGIGRSHALGNIGVIMGKNIHIYKRMGARVEVGYHHMSDPFEPDPGNEWWGIGLGVTYKF